MRGGAEVMDDMARAWIQPGSNAGGTIRGGVSVPVAGENRVGVTVSLGLFQQRNAPEDVHRNRRPLALVRVQIPWPGRCLSRSESPTSSLRCLTMEEEQPPVTVAVDVRAMHPAPGAISPGH